MVIQKIAGDGYCFLNSILARLKGDYNIVMTIDDLKKQIINYLLNNVQRYVNFHEEPKDLRESLATMRDVVLGDVMDFLKSRNYIQDRVDVLMQVVADCLRLNINVYQQNRSYIQIVQISGGHGSKEVNVKFTRNPQNAHQNHYDSIVKYSQKMSTNTPLLYSDVLKKKMTQPILEFNRGSKVNPIIIDDFLPLEKEKEQIDIKMKLDIKQYVQIEELPINLSLPKKINSIDTQPKEIVINDLIEVKEEAQSPLSDVISDVTYVSGDYDSDGPGRPNNIGTPHLCRNSDINFNVSDGEYDNSLEGESLNSNSTAKFPHIGSGNYFPVWLFDDMEPISVDQLLANVNGKKIYAIQTNAASWKVNCHDKDHFVMTSSSCKGFAGIRRIGTCLGLYFCPNTACNFVLTPTNKTPE